jgi:signal peptidase
MFCNHLRLTRIKIAANLTVIRDFGPSIEQGRVALKSPKTPAGLSLNERQLSLPGPALIEILRATLAEGMPFRFRAKGFSMDPFVRDDDVITVWPLADQSPGLGDVVVFIQENAERLLVHRVIRVKESSYVIKGDNSAGADGLIPGSNILGWVKKVERNNKRVFLGFGPERVLIAFLSGLGLMVPLARLASKLHHVFR